MAVEIAIKLKFKRLPGLPVYKVLLAGNVAYLKDVIGRETSKYENYQQVYEDEKGNKIKFPKIEMPNSAVEFKDKMSLNIQGEDVGKLFGFEVVGNYNFDISGKFFATGISSSGHSGDCAVLNYDAKTNFSIKKYKKIKKEEVVPGGEYYTVGNDYVEAIATAKGQTKIEGCAGRCSGKKYCCTHYYTINDNTKKPISGTDKIILGNFYLNLEIDIYR